MPQVVISTVDLGTWQALLARQTRVEAARAEASRSQDGRGAAASGAPAGAAAGDEIEARLAAIWSDILGVQPVGLHDNFFELGGHSLLAVRLLTRIERLFGRAVTMPELFGTPTIAGLAAVLRATESDTRPKAPALRAVSREAFRVPKKKIKS
jgi:acyl carrier protein